jgi:hypothetical protein
LRGILGGPLGAAMIAQFASGKTETNGFAEGRKSTEST